MNRTNRVSSFGKRFQALQLESLEARENPATVGLLDPTFGTNGVALDAANPVFNDVAIQQDGKYVTVGSLASDFFIIRYNANGTVDTTFGNAGNGKVSVDIDSDAAADTATAVVIDSQNRIVVAGGSGGGGDVDFALVRLSADGKTVQINRDYNVGQGSAQDVAIQPDGTIVLVGTGKQVDNDIAIVRVNPDTGAQIGTTFFVDNSGDDIGVGVATYQTGANAGKIAFVGHNGAVNNDLVVGLLNANGTLSTFNGTGTRTFTLGGADNAAGVAITPSGSIIVAGHNTSDFDFAVASFLPEGSFDPAFNGGAAKIFVNAGNDFARDISVLTNNGKIVVVGDTNNFANTAILLVNPDGTLDDLFNFDAGAGDDDGRGVAIAPNGRIVVAGDAGGDGFLLRAFGTTEGVSTRLVAGGSPSTQALVFDPNAAMPPQLVQTGTVAPFGDLGTNVRVATGDVNGDGTPDIILVTGPGTPIRVTVLDGTDKTTVLVPAFNPFPEDVPEFDAGGFVDAGDLDRDGRDELIITPDRRGGPRVVVRHVNTDGSTTQLASFIGIADANFRGGARTAVGDFNGDGVPDIAVAAGFEGGPRVSIFDGNRIFSITMVDDPADKLRVPGGGGLNDFFAFDADSTRNGVYLAAGDVNSDGFADLIFGAAAGNNAPIVRVVSGLGLIQPGGNVAAVNTPFAQFTYGDPANRGGVRVASVDVDADGRADVVAASGEQTVARIRIYPGVNVGGNIEPGGFQELSVFGGAVLADGVFVG